MTCGRTLREDFVVSVPLPRVICRFYVLSSFRELLFESQFFFTTALPDRNGVADF